MGSRKKNWELYPSCLREMARVCRPDTGKAVLLTQNKKCFAKVNQVQDESFSHQKSALPWVKTPLKNQKVNHNASYVLQRLPDDKAC